MPQQFPAVSVKDNGVFVWRESRRYGDLMVHFALRFWFHANGSGKHRMKGPEPFRNICLTIESQKYSYPAPAKFRVGAGTKGDRREFKRRQVILPWDLSLGRGVEEA
jgi:hypothetical protein